jgi:hypothetical protein
MEALIPLFILRATGALIHARRPCADFAGIGAEAFPEGEVQQIRRL